MLAKRINKTIAIAGISGVVVLGAAIGGTSKIYTSKLQNQRAEFEMVLEQKDGELSKFKLSSRKGYVLVKDMKAGDTIKDGDVELTDLPDYFVPTDVINDPAQIIGKVIKLDSMAQTAVSSNMVYEEGQLDHTERKVEIDYVRLPIKLDPKDRIDVRIVFPNGEDYLVLSKKRMQSVDVLNQMLFLNLDIEEIHLMDSALVDAYLHKAEIYALQYVEPEMQDKAPTSYFPNLDVLKVIQSDPRIKDTARYQVGDVVRKSLEQRLKAIKEEDKYRLGADLPTGSAVSKRKTTTGAQITVTQENSATPPEGQGEESKYPAGYIPPAGEEAPANAETTEETGQETGIGGE